MGVLISILFIIVLIFSPFYLAIAFVSYLDPGYVIDPPTFKECLLWGFAKQGWDEEGHKKQWEEISINGELHAHVDFRGRRVFNVSKK